VWTLVAGRMDLLSVGLRVEGAQVNLWPSLVARRSPRALVPKPILAMSYSPQRSVADDQSKI